MKVLGTGSPEWQDLENPTHLLKACGNEKGSVVAQEEDSVASLCPPELSSHFQQSELQSPGIRPKGGGEWPGNQKAGMGPLCDT